MLDPRRLRVLREVAARGSFSAAAAALSFTQSAVSQQVAALERETGTRLVERGVRPVRLTDAGRALVAHAEAVLARLDEAQQELGERSPACDVAGCGSPASPPPLRRSSPTPSRSSTSSTPTST